MSDSCIFCKIIGSVFKTELLFSSRNSSAFYDISPQAPTHILIVPNNHVSKISDLSSEQVADLFLAAAEIGERLEPRERGFRLVINQGRDAGQEVEHLHIHVLAGRQFQWPPG